MKRTSPTFRLSIALTACLCALAVAGAARAADSATQFPIPARLLPPAEPEKKVEVATPVNPVLKSAYDASARRPLAKCNLGELNEEDFLLFLLLNEYKQPDLFEAYQTAKEPREKEELEKALIEQIQDYYYRIALSQSPGAQAPLTEFEQLLLRVMEYPACEFVWIQRVLKPRIQVRDGDMRLYYRTHPEEFITPRKAEVRYVFRAISENAFLDERIEEEKLLGSIRDQSAADPDAFARLAIQYSQAPSAPDGGRIPPFAAGEYFKAFENAAFSLRPGQVSPVIHGPEGLYLIQLIEIDLPEPIPFEQARTGLREKIAVAYLQKHFQYEVNRLRGDAIVDARAGDWDILLEDSLLARVGDFQITKGDFWRLYPEVISPNGEPDSGAINWRLLRLIEYELIRQNVEKEGGGQDPRIQRARSMATAMIHARRAEKQYFEQNLDPRALQVAEGDLNPDPKLFPPRVRLFRVWGEIEEPRRYDATTLSLLRETLPRTLQQYIEQVEAQPDKATAAESSADVPPAVREVKDLGPHYYRFNWSDMGYVDLSGRSVLGDLLRDVEVGRFSPAQWTEDKAVAYYVGAKSRYSPEELRALQTRRRRELAAREETRLRAVFRDSIVQTLNINYLFGPLTWEK